MAKALGLQIDILSRHAVERRLRQYFKAKSFTSHFIVTANAELYYQASRDPVLKRAVEGADLRLPDSAGVLWALRRQGARRAELYPGVELTQWLFGQDLRIYVLGARPEILSRLADRHIAGRHHGFFTPAEESRLISEINRLKPDVVLVALGSGRQELWIAKHRGRLKTKVVIGVGGAIDVLSGAKRRAPYIWRKWRLEWFYRLLREPWRIKRQINLLRFALAVLLERK
ncbi:MAG: WecB/TagA/CpsF family glycosyltransferase [Candidatus Margulisbacteria bacterium]|nr:WecB/TagA/CpsF family glycosyltransferase [Candidatus Margulisiibacteriota bacterium]